MIDYLSGSIADFYVKRNIIQDNEKEVYKWGLSLILNDVVTFALILIFSAIFQKLRFGTEFLLVFCTTRVFCGGYHAPKAYLCRISMLTVAFFVLVGSSVLESIVSIFGLLMLLATFFVMLIPIIPVKHPNKTLTPQLIKRGRIGGYTLYILFALCSVALLLSGSKQDALIIALSLVAVSLLALIGKFTNERRLF